MSFMEPVRTADTSDADIIRVCAEHIANHKAYNATAGVLPLEEDPLWHAYERTLAAVGKVKPRTLAGLAAKARVAKMDATHPDGVEAPGDALEWAWDLVNDLIRLDEERPDAELIAACNEYLRIERAFEAAYAAHCAATWTGTIPRWRFWTRFRHSRSRSSPSEPLRRRASQRGCNARHSTIGRATTPAGMTLMPAPMIASQRRCCATWSK